MAQMKGWQLFAIIAIVAVAGYAYAGGQFSIPTGAGVGTGTSGSAQLADLPNTCPTDGGSTLSVTLVNGENTTTVETFDAGIRLKSNGGDYQTGTNTTGGTYNLNCGQTYTMYVLSADGASGDNSKIRSVSAGEGATVNADGSVTFTPKSDQYTLRVVGSQHATLEFRAYDLDTNAFMCNSDDACNDYETDGVAFESSTNATAKAIGSGGELKVRMNARAVQADTEFCDQGCLILSEAPVATWNAPSLTIGGQVLQNVKGTLTPEEERQFSNYEYIYLYTSGIVDSPELTLEYYLKALDGVNPSTDPELDFAARGAYASVKADTTVKQGAAQDDSSATVVYAVQDVTFDIS